MHVLGKIMVVAALAWLAFLAGLAVVVTYYFVTALFG
jgi:hypothetical protein